MLPAGKWLCPSSFCCIANQSALPRVMLAFGFCVRIQVEVGKGWWMQQWMWPFSFQVYPDGIRHIRADKRVNEWKTPGKKTIVKCAVNQRQVVIALTGGELVYFEMDPVRALMLWKSSQQVLGQILMLHQSCRKGVCSEESFWNESIKSGLGSR